MKYKIFYVIFLVVCILFNNLTHVSAFSYRHIFAIAMLVTCIIMGEFKLDRFLKWYLVFIFFYTLSNILTGYTTEVLLKLFGTYFVAMVMYIASKTMIQKYDAGIWIVYSLLAIAVLDAVVTIGQFYNNPIAQTISSFMGSYDEELYEWYERRDTLHGRSAAGLIGAVSNGYFLSATSLLALYNQKGKPSWINWLLFAFLFFALFLVQERSGLYFGAFCIFIYLVLTAIKKKGNLVSLVFVFLIALLFVARYSSNFVRLEDTRYVTHVMDDGGRSQLTQNGWRFIESYPLGGIMEFHALGNRDTHNFITNALVFGGIFGGIVLISIVLVQLFIIYKILMLSFLKKKSYSYLIIVFSLMYLDYTLNSFFHNASLTSGSVLFFVYWGVVITLYTRENTLKNRLALQ